MEISVERILDLLPSDAQILCRRPTAKIIGLKQLRELDTAYSPDYLYISKAPDLTEQTLPPQGNFLLCTEQEVPPDTLAAQGNLMVVHSIAAYVTLIEQISGLLSEESKLDNISRTLISIIHGGGDIHKLMEYAYSILNNPLMLVDISFNLIAHAGTSVLRNEDAWRYALDNQMFSSKYIGYIMNRSAFADEDHLILGDIRVELPNEVTSVKQYSTRVNQNNIVLGYLKLLEANHPVSDFDLQVFQLFSHYVPFVRSSTRGRIPDVVSLTEDFLHSLLEGKFTNKYEILSRQELYNLKFYKYLYVIGINFIGSQTTNDIISFTLQRIRSYFHNNLVIWVNGCFLVLYDSNEENITQDEKWLSQLSSVLEKLNCTANISTHFHELYQVRNYYQQTLFCTEFRTISKEHEQQQILCYRDIFEYHMILSLGKEVNLWDLLHPAVKKLQAAPSSADLLNTLFVYTKNHCSIPNTAKTMYLHYNTLKNRINRIESLTGFTGEDSRDCLWVMLSVKIMNLMAYENAGKAADGEEGEKEHE